MLFPVWSSTYKSHLVIKDLKDNRSGGHLTFALINTDDNTAIYTLLYEIRV